VDSVDTLDPGDPVAVADDLAEAFARSVGHAPVGVFAAPGRVNLIGEHLDYNGGRCLPMALPHATYAAVAPRPDGRVTVTSRQQDDTFEAAVDDLGPGSVTGWASYVAGVVWALRQAGWPVPGVDVLVDGRVPLGAGLSSSAAIECAVALGVAHIVGVEVVDDVRASLVRACMRAELEVAGAPTGGLDQTIALFGRPDAALLLDCRDWSRRQVPWDPASAGLSLLVVDTRASHTLSDGEYGSRRKQCEEAARQLGVELLRDVEDQEAALATLDGDLRRRVRHVFTEDDRVVRAVAQLEAGDSAALGETFLASHASMRDDYEISCPELDAVVETAISQGALGARMTGGGFGGSAIALVPTESVDGVATAVQGVFDDRGWRSPGFLTGVPSDGARQVR
jgi:galactokinase